MENHIYQTAMKAYKTSVNNLYTSHGISSSELATNFNTTLGKPTANRMNRDILYRNILRGMQDSPQFNGCELSPMTSLANTLLEASLASTPCKRLSLSSTLTETPKSSVKSGKSPLSLSVMNESTNLDVRDLSSSEKSMSPISITSSPRNKENLPTTPYFSPSHCQNVHHRQHPLRELQNTATRSLSFSPLKKPVSPARRQHLSPAEKQPVADDCDSNSRDSGYSESGQKRDGFCVPRSCAPTRRLNLDLSPFKSPSKGRRSLASFRREKSDEDEFFKFLSNEDETADEDSSRGSHDMPPTSAFSSLLSAPIQSPQALSTMARTPQAPKLPIRRCLSLVDTSTPLTVRVKSSSKVDSPKRVKIDRSPQTKATTSLPMPPFKRPQSPPITPNVPEAKRRREDPPHTKVVLLHPQDSPKLPLAKRQLSEPDNMAKDSPRPRIQRCHSESHLSIMKALSIPATYNGILTGDFSLPLSLPIITGGKHPDLNSISIHTMASLIRGEFADKIGSFDVLDCRYPYEYAGGHIKNATNWHHLSMVQEYLGKCQSPPAITTQASSRHIHIFHCEFSAERGPRAQRMIREMDRNLNNEHYPALHCPELYLLEGGYKAFYEAYSELCSPNDYVKMLDENHSEELKFFRSKSKSWAAENKLNRCPLARTGAKRFGL